MVKVLEQYTTKLNSEEHQALQEAVKWLSENGFLKKTNKYEVTRYALKTLVDIVENKKKKATKEPEISSKKESQKEETTSEEKTVKNSVKDLSNGGQGA